MRKKVTKYDILAKDGTVLATGVPISAESDNIYIVLEENSQSLYNGKTLSTVIEDLDEKNKALETTVNNIKTISSQQIANLFNK